MQNDGSLWCLQEPTKSPYPQPDKCIPILSKSTVIFLSQLFLPLPSGLCPSGSPNKTFSLMCGMCPTHLMLWIIKSGKEHKSWRSLFYRCLQYYITASPLGPNIFISTLFSKTLKLCHFLSVGYNVSHLYKARENMSKLAWKMCLPDGCHLNRRTAAKASYVWWLQNDPIVGSQD